MSILLDDYTIILIIGFGMFALGIAYGIVFWRMRNIRRIPHMFYLHVRGDIEDEDVRLRPHLIEMWKEDFDKLIQELKLI